MKEDYLKTSGMHDRANAIIFKNASILRSKMTKRERLCIEIDGGYHLSIEQREKDFERTEYLNSVGITELRFTNSDVMNDIEKVIEKINNKLRINSL